MTVLQSIAYGIVQGLTEFLPISSSGHLSAIQTIFGAGDPDAMILFNLLLHIGTLMAVCMVYYRDIWDIIKGFFTLCGKLLHGKCRFADFNAGERFVVLLILAVIPLALGAVLEGSVEAASSCLWLIGLFWLINGVILLVSDAHGGGNKTLDDAKPKNALLVGLCQLIAIFPGISRSGMTITGGLFNGFDRTFAVKFSFILSIPAILGSTAISFIKDYELLSMDHFWVYAAGMVAALLSGLAAIKLLQFITKKNTFRPFAYYSFAIGAFAFVYGLIR